MIYDHKQIEYKGKVVFHKMTILAPERDLKPFQDNEACFMFVNKGDFSIRTPESVLKFSNNQGLLAKCFNFFVETNRTQRDLHETMEFIGVFLFAEQVSDIMKFDLSASSKKLDFNVKQLHIDKLFNAYKESIDVLLEHPDLADENMVETKIKEFVLLLSKSQNIPPLDLLSGLYKVNQINFKEVIENNIASSLSIDQLAQLCAMSSSTFKRKFKEEYNESPKKYIDKQRLDEAAKQLRSSEQKIVDLAYDLGYSTISTFNRSFKSKFGYSPSEYRLIHSA